MTSRTPGNSIGANQRLRAAWLAAACLALIVALLACGGFMSDAGLKTDFSRRNLPPGSDQLFGTDWLGRDMAVRTVRGLCLSLAIGSAAAVVSTGLAALLGLSAALLGRRVDAVVTGAIDVVMALPHLVLLILISFSLGGGGRGVIAAVAVTHWTRLARVIRAEVLALKNADFVRLSARLGRGPLWIARHHMLPHLLPQFLVGMILIFPHAIMHAAGLTFLGFGLSPHVPSIGVLLSEAMRHLATGYWWLAVAPGAALVLLVKVFDLLGGRLRVLMDPKTSQGAADNG